MRQGPRRRSRSPAAGNARDSRRPGQDAGDASSDNVILRCSNCSDEIDADCNHCEKCGWAHFAAVQRAHDCRFNSDLPSRPPPPDTMCLEEVPRRRTPPPPSYSLLSPPPPFPPPAWPPLQPCQDVQCPEVAVPPPQAQLQRTELEPITELEETLRSRSNSLAPGVLDVGGGVRVDIKDEADTFWAAFDEHVSDVLPGRELAQEFYEKFMEAHCGMFKKLNLEQLEDMAREIFMFLREQELKDAGAGGR